MSTATLAAPRDVAVESRIHPVLPPGPGDRVCGYGVMGLPFASGHYLALRHFTASSFGPAYRSVWHRDPDGRWTVYADQPPEVSCARFLGPALSASHTVPIDIGWDGPSSASVSVGDTLTWHFDLCTDAATRMMSVAGGLLPDNACHLGWLLRSMGQVAGPVMSAGKLRLRGTMPDGEVFSAVPRRVWRVEHSTAQVHGLDIGSPAPLTEQDRLGDFLLPQSGVFFADGAVVFTRVG